MVEDGSGRRLSDKSTRKPDRWKLLKVDMEPNLEAPSTRSGRSQHLELRAGKEESKLTKLKTGMLEASKEALPTGEVGSSCTTDLGSRDEPNTAAHASVDGSKCPELRENDEGPKRPELTNTKDSMRPLKDNTKDPRRKSALSKGGAPGCAKVKADSKQALKACANNELPGAVTSRAGEPAPMRLAPGAEVGRPSLVEALGGEEGSKLRLRIGSEESG